MNEPPERSWSADTYTNARRVSIAGIGKSKSAFVVDTVTPVPKLVPPLVDFSTRICFALLPPDVVGKKK